MDIQSSFSQLNALLTSAQQMAILIGSASFDDLVAGISLGLSLESGGKKVGIFVPQLPQLEMNQIVGAEKLRTDFGQKDLTILLDYPLDKIEKVSSQEEGEQLKLVVKIKPGAEPIPVERVKIMSQDINPQVGVIIGEENLFPDFEIAKASAKWIWLSKEEKQKPWAQIVISDTLSSSSEMVARIIQGLGLPMDSKIARNLFVGIKRATNSFEQLASYKTLETAALCFKVIQGNGRQKGEGRLPSPSLTTTPLEEVEKKEGGTGSFPAPKIFKGATTPRI